MEKAVEGVVREMEQHQVPDPPVSELTKQALVIAEIALTSFRGVLLDKALAISKAIIEYESELFYQK